MSDNREIVKEALVCALETVDDKIPIVGPFMDIPCIDKMERDLVSMIVDYLCDYQYGDIDIILVI